MYQVLYRKWRPQVFSDVVGQEHITKTLMSSVESGRVSHAYLFTGSRGTGKTSCAKILAKAVNCEHPVGGNPCNECASCKGIDNGSIVDVVEIDAASNNGVDNIRDLREETNYMPSQVNYRVYIIDEVHMLSTGAFNALLKTLEEPPEHVKFILATTEVHKLPATILSRCQRFDFKRIAPEYIVERLKFVASQENISLTDDGAMLIARISDGGMRDALSLLDRCASYNETVDEALVSRASGIAGKEHIYALTDAIRTHDCQKALNILNELYSNSCDMERMFSELLSHLRDMMICLTVPNYKSLILNSESEIAKIKAQADSFTLETVLSCMDTVNASIANIKRGVSKKTEAEMAVIKLTSPRLQNDNTAILRRISELESAFRSGKFIADAKPAPAEAVSEPKTPEIIKEEIKDESPVPVFEEEEIKAPEISEETPEESEKVSEVPESNDKESLLNWSEAREIIESKNPMIASFINKSKAVVNGDILEIHDANPILGNFIKDKDNYSVISDAVASVTGKNYVIRLVGEVIAPQAEIPVNRQSSAEPEESPLEALINKAKGLNIEIKEQ